MGFLLRFGVFLLALTGLAQAQSPTIPPIIQSGPFVYSDTQGHFFVIAVRGSSESGLFVAYSPSGIPIQEFSPDQLPSDSLVLFLSFDPKTNRYKQLVVSETHSYNIQGSFRVRLGAEIWMGVDTFNNPYASFVLERRGQKSTILSFVGVEKVILSQNEKAVALLAATQSLEGYKGFVDEYQLSSQGLLLKGNPLRVPQVGIQTVFNNSCFSEDATVLTQAGFNKAKAMGDPGELKAFLSAEKDKQRSILESLITVKLTDDEMTGYLPDKEDFYFVEKQAAKLGDRPVCLISKAEL